MPLIENYIIKDAECLIGIIKKTIASFCKAGINSS